MNYLWLQVQDMFLPPANDLQHHFEFGYVVHTGQRGLYKLELEEMKYIKAIDFNKHNCHPKAVVFVPLGKPQFMSSSFR